jgi:membrane protein
MLFRSSGCGPPVRSFGAMTGRSERWREVVSTLRRGRTGFDEAERHERLRYLAQVQREAESSLRRTPDASVGDRLAVAATVLSRRIVVDDLGTHAGALTYASMLSIPPLLLFAVSVTGFVLAGNAGAQSAIVDAITNLFPSELSSGARTLVAKQLSAAVTGRVSVGILGIAVLLWSASALASRLRRALGTIFGTERTGLLTGRLAGMVIGVLTVAAILGLAALTEVAAFAARIGQAAIVVRLASGLAIVAGELVFFLLLYRALTPGHGPRLLDHLPGTVIFTLSWEALKLIGGFYFGRVIARSSALYGAVGSLFGLVGFLYATSWLLLLGAECSAYRWQRAVTAAPPTVR